MGCDIYGWVEVKEDEYWFAAINIRGILWENYDMFGCLFGVRNYAMFKPIAQKRGIPEDASFRTGEDYREGITDWHSASWITWKEIKEIDWEEESETEDSRIHVYEIKDDGSETFLEKFSWSSELTEEEYTTLLENKEVRKENKIYRMEKLKRKDAISSDWQLLFELMEVLAKVYGDEGVRLIVWFDN